MMGWDGKESLGWGLSDNNGCYYLLGYVIMIFIVNWLIYFFVE